MRCYINYVLLILLLCTNCNMQEIHKNNIEKHLDVVEIENKDIPNRIFLQDIDSININIWSATLPGDYTFKISNDSAIIKETTGRFSYDSKILPLEADSLRIKINNTFNKNKYIAIKDDEYNEYIEGDWPFIEIQIYQHNELKLDTLMLIYDRYIYSPEFMDLYLYLNDLCIRQHYK